MSLGHNSPICDLAAEDKMMVSSDNDGNILVWSFSGSDAKQGASIAGSG